ncbi:MAG: hypothetical protein DLM66_00225 [Candidatus Dormiibacter spiritus]|nr:MAG: hypothetical protein DLM66_00225 [Candidatus Dormibacteraeota bacterium]
MGEELERQQAETAHAEGLTIQEWRIAEAERERDEARQRAERLGAAVSQALDAATWKDSDEILKGALAADPQSAEAGGEEG